MFVLQIFTIFKVIPNIVSRSLRNASCLCAQILTTILIPPEPNTATYIISSKVLSSQTNPSKNPTNLLVFSSFFCLFALWGVLFCVLRKVFRVQGLGYMKPFLKENTSMPPGLCDVGNPTQIFMHVRQAFYQMRHISSSAHFCLGICCLVS